MRFAEGVLDDAKDVDEAVRFDMRRSGERRWGGGEGAVRRPAGSSGDAV